MSSRDDLAPVTYYKALAAEQWAALAVLAARAARAADVTGDPHDPSVIRQREQVLLGRPCRMVNAWSNQRQHDRLTIVIYEYDEPMLGVCTRWALVTEDGDGCLARQGGIVSHRGKED